MPYKPLEIKHGDRKAVFVVPVDADVTRLHEVFAQRGVANSTALAQTRDWNTAVWICTALNELEEG